MSSTAGTRGIAVCRPTGWPFRFCRAAARPARTSPIWRIPCAIWTSWAWPMARSTTCCGSSKPGAAEHDAGRAHPAPSPASLAVEQAAEIDEELQERREIREDEEEQEHERGADEIDIERQPLARRLAADRAVHVEPAQPSAAMGTELRRGHR